MNPIFIDVQLPSFRSSRAVIAFGSDSKNTVSYIHGNKCLLSGNHGPLSDPESVMKFEEAVENVIKTARPAIAGVDLHPDYYSTVHGERTSDELGIPIARIQHHHAHAASCMAEHGLKESLALVFDGTGYGTDGNLWGAELLHVDSGGYRRLATFAAAPLPGGDASVREPVRQLLGRMYSYVSSSKEELAEFCKRQDVDPENAFMWLKQAERNINCPKSHSAGRLFDSVSALLGCAPRIAQEAEAAINLQKAAEACKDKPYAALMPFKSFEKDDMLYIDWSPTFINADIVSSRRNLLALSFHHSLADAAMKMLEFGTAKFATGNIVLSGGVFMNSLLLGIMKSRLEAIKFKAFSHEKIPTNDCGISVGQAVIAALENSNDE
ncbi:MAG TPA: hypothetical protein DET40_21180 [Lentisphaeria bacterium]|nr:MAG: hypothetical protein A2X45_03090 [Lentisphaerae bacterium GWF2_50_93]HCE46065.1 hypothetical protein [Lentisphaeria bacterium]